MRKKKKKSINLDKEKKAEIGESEKKADKIKKKTVDTHKKYEDIHFVDSTKPVWNYSLFSEEDIRNFQQGTHYRLYHLFGAHQATVLGRPGFYFAVWAPNATKISVIGHFNDWDPDAHPLFVRLDKSGIWEGFVPGITKGEAYKYNIVGYR